MSEELLVKNCAPTIAGIKTGNLFGCNFNSREELVSDLRRYNAVFAPKGLFLIPLRISGSWALLYLFRKDKLERDLCDSETRSILESYGYSSTDDYRSCISRLVRKLRNSEGFPHEIGLFLSYPPEDVKGFVENKAGGFKFVGYWKVYGDEKAAKRIFNEYDQCTSDYSERIRHGAQLERLIVPAAG